MRAITFGLRRSTGSAGPSTGNWRGRAPLAALVAACVGLVTVAVSGAGGGVPGLRFLQSGHWVFNSALGTGVHIDGRTMKVDGSVPLDPDTDPGSPVVQTDTDGYVLGRSTTQEFGKSDLTVRPRQPDEADELPVGVEVAGMAYSVRQHTGVVTRFGDHRVVIHVGGPLGRPAYTSDGTLWLLRQDTGQICQLPPEASTVTCPAKGAAGPRTAITVIGDQPVLVDTAARTLAVIGAGGLGRPRPYGDVQVPDSAIVATNDVDGKVAILDPGGRKLHLIDASDVVGDRPAAPPETTDLPRGRYAGIASSGKAVAVVDEDSGTVRTYDGTGKEQSAEAFPEPSKPAPGKKVAKGNIKLSRGEDSQVYADSETGEHVMVVDDDGDITKVDATDPGDKDERKPPVPSQRPTSQPPPSSPTTMPTTVPTSEQTVVPTTDEPTTQEQETDPPETGEPARERRPKEHARPTNGPGREQHTEEPTRKPTAKPKPEDPPKTVEEPARVPSAPGGVRASAGDGRATVNWNGAASNGAKITAYLISWSGGSTTASASARQTVVSGLKNGTSYAFTVRARNKVGTGPGSRSATVTPASSAVPADPPVNLTASESDETIELSWEQPDLNGGTLLHYVVNISGVLEHDVQGTSFTYDTLDNGTTYTFTVRAVTRTPDGKTMRGKPATTTGTPHDDGGDPSPTETPSESESASGGGSDGGTVTLSSFTTRSTGPAAPPPPYAPGYTPPTWTPWPLT